MHMGLTDRFCILFFCHCHSHSHNDISHVYLLVLSKQGTQGFEVGVRIWIQFCTDFVWILLYRVAWGRNAVSWNTSFFRNQKLSNSLAFLSCNISVAKFVQKIKSLLQSVFTLLKVWGKIMSPTQLVVCSISNGPFLPTFIDNKCNGQSYVG